MCRYACRSMKHANCTVNKTDGSMLTSNLLHMSTPYLSASAVWCSVRPYDASICYDSCYEVRRCHVKRWVPHAYALCCYAHTIHTRQLLCTSMSYNKHARERGEVYEK